MKITPYPSIQKRLTISGLFSLDAFMWSSTIADVVIAVVLAIIVFVIVMYVIRHSIKHAGETEKDTISIIGYNIMKKHIGTDEVRGICPERVMGFMKKIDISLYLSWESKL